MDPVYVFLRNRQTQSEEVIALGSVEDSIYEVASVTSRSTDERIRSPAPFGARSDFER